MNGEFALCLLIRSIHSKSKRSPRCCFEPPRVLSISWANGNALHRTCCQNYWSIWGSGLGGCIFVIFPQIGRPSSPVFGQPSIRPCFGLIGVPETGRRNRRKKEKAPITAQSKRLKGTRQVSIQRRTRSHLKRHFDSQIMNRFGGKQIVSLTGCCADIDFFDGK